jgi:hypothetical protein
MSPHIDAGEANDRHGGGNSRPPGRAQPREGRRAHSHGHARVPGEIPEPGSLGAAGPGPADQRRWPGPAYHPFDQLGQGPAGRAAGQKPARELTVVSQQSCGGCRGHGAERTELHDHPHGTVERVGQSVDSQEGPGLALPNLVPARR